VFSILRSPLFKVLALWAAGLGAAAQFAKIVVIFPELQAYYGETGAASGYLVSLISVMGMLLGLVAGLIAIQLGIRRLLIAGLFLGAAVSAWQTMLPGFEWMLASRLLRCLPRIIGLPRPGHRRQISSAAMWRPMPRPSLQHPRSAGCSTH
jgi:DHA1 family inner membrane transport protein